MANAEEHKEDLSTEIQEITPFWKDHERIKADHLHKGTAFSILKSSMICSKLIYIVLLRFSSKREPVLYVYLVETVNISCTCSTFIVKQPHPHNKAYTKER